MDRIVVLCDNAVSSESLDRFEKVIQVDQFSPNMNLRLQLWNVSHWLLRSLTPIAHDLLEIAAFVYYADNSVTRGTLRDVFNEDWVRDFKFVIPVRKLDFWQQRKVQEILIEVLEYLTGDKFDFQFTDREPRFEQLTFDEVSEALPPCPDADCVTLFSGGMDSLAGTVELYSNGKKPLLVSHQSRPALVRLQRDLIQPLRERNSSWDFPHLGVWINRMGTRALEYSQRSRSFLFLALGSLVAHELGLSELYVCENGITTFNFPRLGQITDTLATRSTHPRFIELFQELIDRAFSHDLIINTPFIWKTRAEVAEVLRENKSEDLLSLSISCARSQQSRMHPHCGTCSQCVDRRFAVAFAGLDTKSELITYEKDIFYDELEDGVEKMQAVSTVEFALDVRKRDSIDSFCEQYVEAYDAIDSLPLNSEQVLQAIFDMHKRFADEVTDVMRGEYSRSWERVANRELPDNCLLMLTSATASRRPNRIVAQRAGELAQKLKNCPVGQIKPFEDVCADILVFLFCEDLPSEKVLEKPLVQHETDQGYERRDLVFRNRATKGFWADIKQEFNASAIIADPKNHDRMIEGDIIAEFSTKYLKEYKLGRFGIVIGREVPPEVRTNVSRTGRTPSAVQTQKDLWRDDSNMILLLDDEDLKEMLKKKVSGQDPTDLLSDRIFILRGRM